MYFLGHIAGWNAQEVLWAFLDRNALLIHSPAGTITDRMRSLMEKYKDVPMDLADASLVALAEETGLRQVFTLDTDFFIYRTSNKNSFDVIP